MTNEITEGTYARRAAATAARLARREGFLTQSDLAAPGLERRAADVVPEDSCPSENSRIRRGLLAFCSLPAVGAQVVQLPSGTDL